MNLRESMWKIVIAVGACATAIYFVVPGGAQDVLYAAFGAGSVVGILSALRLQRPEDPLGWYLLAVAGACFTLGDDVLSFYYPIIHTNAPFPSIADALYLAGYPFLLVGVLRLTRSNDFKVRREDNADAAIVGLGALALLWHFLMSSYVHDASIGTFGKLVNLAYPVMDVVLLFVLVQALLSGRAREPFHKLLALAMAVMFFGDVAYDILVLHNSYQSGSFSDAFYLVEYVLVAAAALHPSVATATVQLEGDVSLRRGEPQPGRGRLPLIILAGFVAPSIMLVSASLGLHESVVVLACLSLLVFVVICLRLAWMVRRLDAQTAAIELSRRELQYAAHHDELTGVANRARMYVELEHALRRDRAQGSSVALCFGDLDRFKGINDTLGQQLGDRVLKESARILESVIAEGDVLARMGGDEFAVLIADAGDERAAEAFARQMVEAFQDGVTIDGHRTNVTLSVGVAVNRGGYPVEQMLSEANAALQAAKSRGRGGVDVFEPSMQARLLERSELTDGLRGALERDEFLLEYQPVVSLVNGRLLGFEALVRWDHPLRGRVAPGKFIPIAEETGFIVSLGRWAFLRASEQLAGWGSDPRHDCTIAVNLSRRQMTAPDLLSDVDAALRVSGVHPSRLVVEVTETTVMEHLEQSLRILSELRARGVRIAIDDFGTGYSSLSLLQQLPVDILKVDKAFVDPLNRSEPASSSIVGSIVELAHALDLEVIAEGIERQDQLDRLRDLGCDAGQGFLLGHPLDGSTAAGLILTEFAEAPPEGGCESSEGPTAPMVRARRRAPA